MLINDDKVSKKKIKELESELARKQYILDSYAIQYGTVKDQQKVIDKAKAEAVREFAERLKSKAKPHYFDNCNFAVPINDIDNLLKKMYGKENET